MYAKSQEVISNCRKLEQGGFGRAGGDHISGNVPESEQMISLFLNNKIPLVYDMSEIAKRFLSTLKI